MFCVLVWGGRRVEEKVFEAGIGAAMGRSLAQWI
jgi:hypothetical protein